MDGTGADETGSAGFVRALGERAVVLDGGLSNELEAAGHGLADALWSARLLRDEPAALTEAHRAYALAGAEVATTASYQASFEGFARHGIDAARTRELLALSVAAARASGSRWVAASVGPYGAMLADGSEYRGRYGVGRAALERFHGPRVEALLAAGPDVLALETVPDVDEARALLAVVRGCGVPVWLSYSVAGGETRAGQSLDAAFGLAAGADEVAAVGVNCCEPREVADAVRRAVAASGKPGVAYPNSGERWDAHARGWRSDPSFAPDLAAEWYTAGARLIGGCCRVGPEGIRGVADVLRAGA
ncbi:homocysteine S-methyltransferase [Streptomyces sp. NPDC004959]|uniref:homocysteine S-methyltransferase n=1 Tax=unclassified Streptomyces TaxID=2593676 RepID=UPI0004C699AF|nr:homocysteine S-methyltransferase [Streptomyces sp. NRRL F-5630]